MARERLKAAESHFQTAEILDDWDDTDDPYRSNSMISNYVLAGIAASDAICCASLGEHAQGENHQEALALIQKVTPGGKDLAGSLATLLGLKTSAAYGAQPLGLNDVKRAERSARKLLDGARTTVT